VEPAGKGSKRIDFFDQKFIRGPAAVRNEVASLPTGLVVVAMARSTSFLSQGTMRSGPERRSLQDPDLEPPIFKNEVRKNTEVAVRCTSGKIM